MAEYDVYGPRALMGTTQRTKSNRLPALPVAQKSAGSTGGDPSGEFGARNSPRAVAPTTHGGYGRNTTAAAGSPTTPAGGAAPPTRVRGDGAGFGVQEPGIYSTGCAMPRTSMPRRHGDPAHRAGERGIDQQTPGE
jgi:hypothetical protein